MTILLVVLEVIALGGLVVYLQIRYAQANYPKSWPWQWALFLSAFIFGVTCFATIIYQEVTRYELLLFSLLTGISSGLVFGFLFPHNMRHIYPKRTDESE